MPDLTDHQLLREYNEKGSEAAFAQLVRRHLGLVYGVAQRQVQDHGLASDVSQAVFILLARKAGRLGRSCVLAGWLFRTTRFVAARAWRSEQRRQHREQEALARQELHTPDETWKRLAPELDEALASLGAQDRDALLLRFGEGRNYREVGQALGLGEEAAKKRSQRALEKLRAMFARQGLALPTLAIATALGERLVASPPGGLLETVLHHSRTAEGASGTAAELARDSIPTSRRLGWAVVAGCAALLLHLVSGRLGWSGNPSPKNETVVPAGSMTAEPTSAGTAPSPPPTSTGAGFRLLVLAAETGEPIVGASVPVNTVAGGEWLRRDDQFTDEQGVCLIPLPAEPLGRLDVGVNAPGWIPRFYTWRADREEPLPAGYTLRLRPATVLGGVVLNPERQPIPGVAISATIGNSGDSTAREPESERLGFVGALPVATTDAQGRWLCRQIPPGFQEFTLEFQHPDFVTTRLGGSGQEFPRLQAHTAEVILQPGAAATGSIIDAGGHSIVGARVGTKYYLPHGVTAADGSFVLGQLKPGPVTLLATADHFAPKLFPATAGGPPVVVRLESGGILRVRIVDALGEPISGAWLALEQWSEGDQLAWRGTSDLEGRIEWSSAPPDQRLIFTVAAPGFTYARGVGLRSDGQEQTVTLRRARVVIGSVVDAETREPIPAFRAFPGYGSSLPEFDRSEFRRGTNGTYRLAFSEAQGSWVRVEAEGYQVLEAELQEIAPDQFRTDFALRKATEPQTIQGQVLLPDGTPAAGAQVALCTLAEGAILGRGLFLPRETKLLTQTDSAGRFTLPWSRAPHTTFAVSAAGFGRARVRNGQEIAITLEPFGRIEGRVSRDGEVVVDQRVQLILPMMSHTYRTLYSDVKSFESRTDAAGRFVLEFVPPGDSSLYLSYGPGTAFSDCTPITVAAGETLEVVVGERAAGSRDVVGRLHLSEPALVKDWKRQVKGSLFYQGQPAIEPPANLSREEKVLWEVDWSETPAARERERSARAYPLTVNPDGSFRVRGVRPGKYRLHARVNSADFSGDESRPDLLGGWLAQGSVQLEVPPAEGDPSAPIDAGIIGIHARLQNPK